MPPANRAAARAAARSASPLRRGRRGRVRLRRLASREPGLPPLESGQPQAGSIVRRRPAPRALNGVPYARDRFFCR